MVRSIQANKNILQYLESFNASEFLTVGLILGQTSNGKEFIVHLAKTTVLPALKLKNLTDIQDLWLTDHAKQASRMLSGGMYVIGVFLVSEADLLNSFPVHLKSIMSQLNKALNVEYMYGNSDSNEKIVLNYCTKSKSIKCKVFEAITSSVKPAELKFTDDPLKWIKLECKYGLDQTYYLEDKSNVIDLKKQMEHILKDVCEKLKTATLLYDGEFKNEEETLEAIGKKKKNLRKVAYTNMDQDNNNKSISVTILHSCNEKFEDVSVKNTNNQIQIVGQIFSTVWLNPTISFKKASNAVIQDILRSLSTRLEMHWDSLIEEEHKEDSNSIHEPPRRVMISVSGISVSDYLFPGEGAEEAQNSVEEILDIKLKGRTDEIQDVEGSVDIAAYGKQMSRLSEGHIVKEKEHRHFLLMIGSIFALIVLIFSIGVHVLLKYF